MNAPEVGKTYKSTLTPELTLTVNDVTVLTEEENEGFPATFFVEASHPEDSDDMTAMGYELDEDEWKEHGFIPA